MRQTQVWFGILGLLAGAAILLTSVLTTSHKAQAAGNNGIGITIVHAAAGK